MKRINYVIANWKMNGVSSFQKIFIAINKQLNTKNPKKPDVIVCPPFTLISQLASYKKFKIKIGAQDTHEKSSGAYTGCVSSEMIKDAGAEFVIIGHSERRQYFNEDIKLLSKKITSAHKAKLKVIFCIGEQKSEIKNRLSVLKRQLKSLPNKLDPKNLIIAYEPVWAIGTGLTPTLNQIDQIHASIRKILKSNPSFSDNVSILYGGSVNGENANEILSLDNVDGALVGGASLKIKEFSKIIDYYS